MEKELADKVGRSGVDFCKENDAYNLCWPISVLQRCQDITSIQEQISKSLVKVEVILRLEVPLLQVCVYWICAREYRCPETGENSFATGRGVCVCVCWYLVQTRCQIPLKLKLQVVARCPT